MLDWNDLRYVQVIARAGNIADAADALGMHQSTVFRRLNTIEKNLGVRLFERFSTGYVATPAGEEFCQTAKRIEADILNLDRKINGRDMRPSGVVRVTTNDILLKLLTASFAAQRQFLQHNQVSYLITCCFSFCNTTSLSATAKFQPVPSHAVVLRARRTEERGLMR